MNVTKCIGSGRIALIQACRFVGEEHRSNWRETYLDVLHMRCHGIISHYVHIFVLKNNLHPRKYISHQDRPCYPDRFQ